MTLAYIRSRILGLILVLIGTTTLVFLMVRLSGDPVLFMVTEDATREEIEQLRHILGLDAPLHVQYAHFLKSAATGNFGESFHHHRPALSLVLDAFPNTLQLALFSISVSLIIAIPVGVICALRRNSLLDRIVMLFSVGGQSIPTFWLGIMLIFFFAVRLNLLPTSGKGGLKHLVLPGITLGSYVSARITRLTRSNMVDVLMEDYLRTARSKGLSERTVITRHALKNAAIGVVTLVGVEFGQLMGGAIITETVFAWPGIGRLALNALWTRDYPLVQATVFHVAVFFAVINLVVDILCALLDPRISYAKAVD
jgi:peptide/nickel transport system permease protein